MARHIGKICKKSRRIGTDLGLKSRSGMDISNKCKLNVFPGQHGVKKRKHSNYSLQLSAKQMLKYMYGILEKQFKNYYKKASKSKMITGNVLLTLLETRLDNVVYRMGFASTRAEARQLVRHKSIIVKSFKTQKELVISIPSYSVSVGDIIKISDHSKNQFRINASLNYMKTIGFVDWVEVDINNLFGVFKRIPDRDNLPSEIKEQMVVELYSK
ncbi:MAG: 30S ribosomal protein S4 [Candidatus Azosocius agrarius]|nr:MAG: 30S ribosomal protein S4 [Gammaproteobacteria bacterium]